MYCMREARLEAMGEGKGAQGKQAAGNRWVVVVVGCGDGVLW